MAIKQTFDELKLTTRLPSPPGVGMRVLELTRGEDYSAQDIADAIMADSALTGRLLKIANNALNSSAHPVTTISEATMRLGVMAVRNVALGLSLISANRQGNCAKFDYERYWSVSLARAIAAQAISRHRGQISPSEAYVMGLLCDIGSLAIASVYATEYGELLEQNPGIDRRDLAELERQAFGINHCEIGAFMVQDWGLPGSYSQAILAYEAENPTMATRDPAGAKLAVILNDAEKIARVLLLDDSTHPLDWPALVGDLDGVHERMGLSPEESSAFHEKLSRELREWLRMLKLPNHDVIELVRVRQTAQQASEQAQEESTEEASAEETVVEEETQVTTSDEASTATDDEGIRILVADDDSSSLNVLKQTLTRAGHTVISAKDGHEALQLALEHNPQAVIADWSMPGMDGLELCRALRSIELGREIYFLLLTGGEDEQRIVHAFDAGVDDFISKPLSPRMLLARLKGGQRLLQLKAERERDQQRMIDQVKELTIAKRRLKAAASTDALTELPNRRAILEVLDAEWAVSCGSGAALSVMMIDIDHFKRINDQHGHDVGDEVLRQVARALRGSIRQGEEVARLGGEEFLVVCPNSNLEQCLIGAERIRRAVELQMIHFGSFHGSVTASFGVAQRTPGMTESAMLLKTADEAVYAAKAAGRNCVHPRAEGSIKAQSA